MIRKVLFASIWLCCALPVRADEVPLVLVSDGAGDYRGLSNALQKEVDGCCLPLEIEPAAWSHGYGRSIADQCDEAHIRREGKRLADKVLACRMACPNRPVYLMAHSAGAGVVLAAGHSLPPNSVDRIILLAPTVPAHSEIRPALCCSRQGVDVFHSHRDRLGLFVSLCYVCKDGRLCDRCAARTGFATPSESSCCDHCSYEKLRQYGWVPALKSLGNDGRHYGIYQPAFLHAFIFPMLLGSE